MGGSQSYSAAQVPDLSGKVAIITGANSGIGRVTATELARKGSKVILACRSKEKTEEVVEAIKKETGNEKVEFMELNLASLQSVQKFVNEFKQSNNELHILVNNAGVMMCPFKLSEDGIELQFATNHLGHFHLTNLLLETLERSAPSRVVNVSSAAHALPYSEGVRFDKINDEASYSNVKAYGQSKLCNILFSKQLSKQLGDKKVYVNAVHPGYVATDLQRHLKDSWGILGHYGGAIGYKLFALSPEEGALSSLYAATSPDIETNNWRGEYFVPKNTRKIPSALSRNDELAEKLMEFSEKLVKEKIQQQGQ